MKVSNAKTGYAVPLAEVILKNSDEPEVMYLDGVDVFGNSWFCKVIPTHSEGGSTYFLSERGSRFVTHDNVITYVFAEDELDVYFGT